MTNKKQETEIYLGACRGCYRGINNLVFDNYSDPPEWSITNTLFFGMLLYELSCLNQVELDLCKFSIVGGQIFTLYAVSHTSIKGHHTLYYNKPEFTSKVFNFYKQHNDWQQQKNNGINNDDELQQIMITTTAIIQY